MNTNQIEVITELSTEAHEISKSLGWYEERENLLAIAAHHGLREFAEKMIEGSMIALQHSELSEGLEGIRKDLKDDHLPQFSMIECELADAMIRILDHAAWKGYKIAEAMAAKMQYNKGRGHKHGGKAF